MDRHRAESVWLVAVKHPLVRAIRAVHSGQRCGGRVGQFVLGVRLPERKVRSVGHPLVHVIGVSVWIVRLATQDILNASVCNP
jgi:hypothetical protein